MPALLRYLFLLLLTFGSSTPWAQNSDQTTALAPVATPAQTLDQLSGQLDSVKTALTGKTVDVPLADLRTTASSVQEQARQLAASLAPQMAALQAQLTVLGPPPEKGQPAEAPEVSAQRRQINKAQSSLDAQIKQAQLLSQNGLQLAAQISGLRNDQFQARLTSRTATPLSRAFWADPVRAFPDDLMRVKRLGGRWHEVWQAAWQPPNRQPLLLSLIAAALLLAGGRRLLDRLLLNLATRRVPDGHLRRSAMAVAVALTPVLTTGLAAQLVRMGLNWYDTLDVDLDALLGSTVRLICAAAYVVGLGRALLSVSRPSWRLPPLSNRAARRLRPLPWLLGGAVLLLGLVERIGRTIGTSLSATVATHALIALVIGGLTAAALLRQGEARRTPADPESAPPAKRPLWIGVLGAAATLGVLLSWIGVITGYIALAFFVAVQMLWIGVIVGTTYLLIHLLQDLCNTLLSPRGRSGQRLQTTFQLNPNTLEQTATVLSGCLRVGLLAMALAAVLAPFGASPNEFLTSAEQTFSGLRLGELKIQPGTILSGVAVFVIGLIVLRMLKRWLGEQLLPKTAMEPGMRASVLTLIGYVGGLLIFTLTLAALHVDLKSIAWIASALSVGIGFGLQAIVQNFISGLILLVERPVKVGDWVSLGDVEGDIRRINVRATEIQLSDRSTMIVPNSQLITQNVRNVTLANALGRVQIKLPLPLETDADQARQLLLNSLAEHPGVLPAPPPSVQMGDIDAQSMILVATAYVSSPRVAGSIKSDLLFEILARLRHENIPLARTQDMRLYPSPPIADDSLG